MLLIHYYHNKNENYPFYTTEETYQLFLNYNDLWEDSSITLFYNLINKEDEVNIIDIGAGIGLYSLYAKFLPKATFYSFEPTKETFRLLNDNLKLNNINNVKTFELALSNEKTEKTLNICKAWYGLNTLGDNPLRFDNIEKSIVNTDTIDNLFYDKEIKVDFIKIDTEGYELYILQGGIKTIDKYKPIIQLEYNITNMKQCNVEEQELLDFIESIDYCIINKHDEEYFIAHKSRVSFE